MPNCAHCNKEFEASRKQRGEPKRFCTASCRKEAEKLRRYAKGKLVSCLHCQKEFRQKMGVERFCSRSCGASYTNSKRITKYSGIKDRNRMLAMFGGKK